MTRKIILITVACSLLIAYGVFQRRLAARSGLFGGRFTPANVRVGVEPPPGSKFVRSYVSGVNGIKTRFGHYVSALSAPALVGRFVAQHPGARRDVFAPGMIRGAGCTAAGYAEGSHVIGIVAVDTPGGCNFFITRAPMSAVPRSSRVTTDVPGVDAPGVPRPLNSIRKFSVENLGGIPSVLAFYEGWGTIGDNVDHLKDEMPRRGWKESHLVEQLMDQTVEGEVLSFTRGARRCFIYFEKDPRSSKLTTAVLYREKNWLPPDHAY